MTDYEDFLRKIDETQQNAVNVIMEAQKMKEAVEKNSEEKLKDKKDCGMVMIPYAALEMSNDRHDEEKEKIRKHYRAIIIAICSVFVACVIGFVSLIFYFFNNYDFCEYHQDVESGNANYIGKDGDITNGEANYYMGETKIP